MMQNQYDEVRYWAEQGLEISDVSWASVHAMSVHHHVLGLVAYYAG